MGKVARDRKKKFIKKAKESHELLKIKFDLILIKGLLIQDKDDQNQNKEIIHMINFLFDALEAIPEKNTVYALIKSNCSLKYDLNTLKNNINAFKAKFTYHQLFAISEMPEAVFQKYLYEHNIFEIKSQKIMVMFDFSFLKEIIIKLMKALSDINAYLFYSFDEFFSSLNSLDEKFKKLYDILESNEKENSL